MWLRLELGSREHKGDSPHPVSLPREVLLRFRIYLVPLLADFLVSLSQWLCGYLFQRLTKILAIDGWEGTVILAIHGLNIALAFATFGILFALDVIEIRKRTHSH